MSTLKKYIVVGVYAEPEVISTLPWQEEHQRFAHEVEAADPEAAERAAMIWADTDIIIGGTIELTTITDHHGAHDVIADIH